MLEQNYAKYVRARDAAKIIGVSVSTLAKWRMRKEGPPYKKIGRRIVAYPVAEIAVWMETSASELRHF